MKEIIALIRPEKAEDTKKALEAIGLGAFTGRRVMGKGKMPIDVKDGEGQVIMKSYLLPKRLLVIEAADEDVERIITIITLVNSTGEKGDGRIFVVPVESSYSIHSGEKVV